MKSDPIRGKSFRWTFDDGVMKGRSFNHSFSPDGRVKFGCTDGTMNGEGRYEYSPVSDDVYAVSYQVDGGYTLTTILDTKTHKMVSFASKDGDLQVQHGTFEEPKPA